MISYFIELNNTTFPTTFYTDIICELLNVTSLGFDFHLIMRSNEQRAVLAYIASLTFS